MPIGARRSLIRRRTASASGDADADALFARMTALGETPNAARQTLCITLIAALKSHSIWTNLDVFYVMAAHGQSSAKINWKLPGTYDLTAVNSPIFTTNRGFAGNGSSMYLSTGWNPVTNGSSISQNSTHLQCWDLTATAENSYNCGWWTGSAGSYLLARDASDHFIARVNGAIAGSVSSTVTGCVAGVRVDSTNTLQYRDGSLVNTSAIASVALGSATLYTHQIGDATLLSTHQLAQLSAGGGMNTTAMSNYRNDMYNYLHDASVGAV